jgi:hypothetical protein
MQAPHGIGLACRCVLSFACLGWIGATVRADEPIRLEEVVVTGASGLEVGSDDAASQGVVTAQEIKQRPLARPGEILEAIPGMIVTQHSGDGKANQYFLRGYNLDHGTDFATWVAGMPVNMPTHAHGQGYTDLGFLIPELIARVDYSKGPYFAQYGDFSSVGTARISLADALPAPLVSLTAGSFGYSRGLAAGSPALGGGNMVYGLEYVQNDGPWEQPNKFAKLNGVLRYAQGTRANGFNLTAMGYEAHWNATDQIASRAVAAGLINRFGSLDSTDGGNSSRYSASAEWRQSDGEANRSASAYVVRSRLELFSNFTYFLANPVNGDQFEQAEKRTLYGGSVSQTWFSHVGERHMWNIVGLQLRRDRLSPVALYATEARRRLAVVRQDDVTVSSAAVYWSNTIAWTEWFRTIAGLRPDFYRSEVAANLAANSGKSHDSIVSPKLSLVFGPWASSETFVNFGRGFHSNDARGTTITVDPKTGNAADRVSPLVRTTGYEAGLRSQAVRNMSFSASLWELKQDSELLFVGDAGTTEPSRPSRRTGVELIAQYRPRSWLVIDTEAAFTRARFADTDPAGNYIPGAPNRVISAGLAVDNNDGWFGALRWRYFGPRPLVEDNSARSNSTSLVNARVGYAFARRARIALDALNLFNRKDNDIDYFYTSRLQGEAPAGVGDLHFHPVEPRSLRLTVSFELH